MKINEVESQVGITKKNIRFYESEGLLTPRRNTDNGYRDYGDEEIKILKSIKLFRKLGFPLDEIRKMQKGILTVSDGMDRHRVLLERESKNITLSISLCDKLASSTISLDELDEDSILDEMEALECKGAYFQNRYEKDRKINMLTAVIISSVLILIMLAITTIVILGLFSADTMPTMMVGVITVVCMVIILAVVFVLFARLQEIKNGEIEQAKRY